MTLNEAIQIMTNQIVSILAGSKPTIYLFGSVALDDFKLGWSDIDMLVLTESEITEQQANILVELRQNMLKEYPDNPYFRLFEGGMLSADAFLNGKNERTVYWETSGQRITDNYKMDSFGMAELIDSGILLHGDDVREKMNYPSYTQMREDISNHVATARKHGVVVGWLLDIARGIYTLRTGKIIAKTAAGEWALKEGLCPDLEVMRRAVQIRKEPHRFTKEDKVVDNAVIGRFADVLDDEFIQTASYPAQAESELCDMGISYKALTLIRQKDGVVVWRVTADTTSYVMKCFIKGEYRREITNYQILTSLGIPTLKIIAYTESSLLMEDIEHSSYRLGTIEDINNPQIAVLIAQWYKILHDKGFKYASLKSLYDECDCLTTENIKAMHERTGTSDISVWKFIEDNFAEIKSAAMNLPRTLTYNDFHYTNLVVARDGTSAFVFDYNMLGKGYIYADIRNVCSHIDSEEARAAFISEYGSFDEKEKIVDDVVCSLNALHIACQRKHFPDWGNNLLAGVKDGRLQAAVEKLLEKKNIMSFDEFLNFRNVKIRNKDHERIVRMFYSYLTSVCSVPEALSRLIGEIIGVDFSGASILTGCFNGKNNGIAAPYGTPDLYCKWDNGIHVHVYGTLPKSNFTALQPNEYVLFALSDQITTNVERTADHHIYMRCAQ